MADQDFNITIRTIADTTGITLTQQGLNSIKIAALQGNQQAIAALKQLTAASREAAAAQKEAQASIGGGFTGTAVGIGTMLTVMGATIRKVQQWNEEEGRLIEKIITATDKMRAEALEVAAIKDLDFSEELIKQSNSVEELSANFQRLTLKIAALKAEQDALDPLTQVKEWKELRTEINAYESQLKSVQSTLQQKGVTDATPKIPGPKAGRGESQALVDQIERNRKAAEEQLKEDVWEFDPETGGYRRTGQKRFPAFQPPPPPPPGPNANQYPSPIGPPLRDYGDVFKDILTELQILKAIWQ